MPCAERVKEETGLEVHPGPIIETLNRVHRDPDGRIRYHFVIIDFVCESSGGNAVAGSDAEAVAWVTAGELDAYGVNAHAAAVIRPRCLGVFVFFRHDPLLA